MNSLFKLNLRELNFLNYIDIKNNLIIISNNFLN